MKFNPAILKQHLSSKESVVKVKASSIRKADPPENTKKKKNKYELKLESSQFRFINEKLYTMSGGDAEQMFRKDPSLYTAYQTGYANQIGKWPVNPVDDVITLLKTHPATSVIADMGCGTAKIAQTLTTYTVHSFDLCATNSLVTECNIAATPLKDNSIDIVVFCLSLMGTNLVDYLHEANRILKVGKFLYIAEVKSRIASIKAFTKKLKSIGFKIEPCSHTNKVFVILKFSKTSSCRGKDIELELAPCLYKKQ